MVLCYYSAPGDADARGMEEMGVEYQPATQNVGTRQTPGEWLEYSPILTVVICTLGFLYLIREVATSGASVILELNHYVFLFLIVGMLLHWRPRSFVQAIAAAVAPVGGVLIQYPLYAGIVRMMTESGIATQMAHFFVAVSTQHTYPIMIGIYSAFLGLFIPSAGRQVADRSAVHARGREDAGGPPRVGGADLQRHRGARQPHSPVLDAAARRHPRPQSPRHRRLLDAPVRRPRSARALPRLGTQLHPSLCSASSAINKVSVPRRLGVS